MNKKKISHYKKKFLNQGFILLKNVISDSECESLKLKSETLYKRYGKYYSKYFPLEKTVYNLHNKDKQFLKYLDHKEIYPLVKTLLSTGSYQDNDNIIIQQTALRSPKHNYEQGLHNDARIIGCKYPLVVQVIWLLDDFTKDNGATRIVKGSQKLNSFPKNKKYKNEKILTAKKGSVLIFNGAVWHGSSKNVTKNDRWGMIFRYSRWFLKPSFDFNKNTPKKNFLRMNSTQKSLLGFNFNPPKDEFVRISSRTIKAEFPQKYYLRKS